MKNKLLLLLIICCAIMSCDTGTKHETNTESSTPYGNNTKVGKYLMLNGAKIYFEEYGSGEPLLIIHGNSGNIQSMENQIDFFKHSYRVIVADNRGHGKSELKTDSLTYKQITSDWEGLVNYLKLDSFSIIGWSDGGIVALEMGISSKTKVKKIVAMGANLRPDSTAVHAWAINHDLGSLSQIKTKIENNDTSENWNLHKQLVQMLLTQPNITYSDMQKIRAQVLIMAGDEDITKNRHSVEMYEGIPHAQLCIVPGETHNLPVSNPELFNTTALRFIKEPFKRPYSNF